MSFRKQAEFLRSIRQLVAWRNEHENGPKMEMSHLIQILDEYITECISENGIPLPECDESLEDLNVISPSLRALKKYMGEHSNPDTNEEWEEFERTPVTIGWGDHIAVLPTCAATHNGVTYFIRYVLEEVEM